LPAGSKTKSRQTNPKLPAHFATGQEESKSKIQSECQQLQKILQLLASSFNRDKWEGLSQGQMQNAIQRALKSVTEIQECAAISEQRSHAWKNALKKKV
jgi:hypothetical protein